MATRTYSGSRILSVSSADRGCIRAEPPRGNTTGDREKPKLTAHIPRMRHHRKRTLMLIDDRA